MKLNYSATMESDKYYDVLSVDILTEYQFSKGSGELVNSGVTLRLQRGGDDRPHSGEWYGLSIKLETSGNNVSASSTAYRGILGICKKILGYDDGLPAAEELLTHLVEHGMQWVYDSREGPHYVKPETVKPPDYRTYCDGSEGTYCTVNVVANSEDSAKQMIAARMAITEHFAALQKWAADGMPIRTAYYNHAPTIVNMQSLLTVKEMVEVDA